MRFIATTSDKMDDIDIVSGQLIFSRDDRVIYLDTDVRTSFQQIITVVNEQTRQELVSPVNGFYFIEDTKTLWRYNNSQWQQVTEPPKENLVFAEKNNFPIKGQENILYVDKNTIYTWDSENNVYIEVGALIWESIS